MTMSASKQNKRQANCTDSEQCRPGKKTKIDSSRCLISLKPHISLKWDQYLRKVVPEKEQVGILWSDMAPFMENQKHCSGLADVTYVPPETFSLKSLKGVLSYEVWSTSLTEAERKFLIQFLPSETDAEENVYSLLTGKNHHFGNPFLSWSSSVCYGDVHPDALLNKEKYIKRDEKAYRVNLLNYHSNMVETLKNWKKRWLSCSDAENLFRDNPGNQMQGVMQLKATKNGMPMKVAARIDVSKFMSYIKVSRTQLNHIKRLKQSGDGIQTKHVSRVIGGLDKSHVKPYGALLEDEQRRLREHWLKMCCNDLPASFEVLRERKVLMEKSRKLLGLELEQKNVSVLRKADQLTDKTKGLGQPGASEIDGTPVFQNDQVECSPQSILQGGHYQSTSLQDQDDEQSAYHIHCMNAEDHDLMVIRGMDITSHSEQNSDVPYKKCHGVSCIDKGIYCCANNPNRQSEVLMDIKLCKDGLVDNPNCKNMQLEDLDGVSYKGASIQAYEQDQNLESISHAVVNHKCHHSPNIYSDMSHPIIDQETENIMIPSCSSSQHHPKINTVIDQEETENIMIPACSSSQLPKSSGEQMHVEDFVDPNYQTAKVEKVRWQLAGPLQSHYRPLENITYNGSGDLQIKQPYLSSGQHNSSVYLNNGILSQQQPQLATSAFAVDNLQSHGQLETAKDIGAVSYPYRHANSMKQSTGLHSLVNKSLAQSAPFPRLLKEQHQLIDQSDNGLYAQLDMDYNTDVSFPTKVNLPISEQHSYAAFDSMDHRYNWFPEGFQSHNNNDNLLGLQSGNCLPQALPSGSSTDTDGTLFSAVSQYKQASVHMGHGSSHSQLIEPSNQFCPPQNFLSRSQDTNPTFPDMYGFSQNMGSGISSQVAPVGSLDSSHWTNFIQQNPGMPSDFTNRPLRGPWTR